MVGGNDLLLRVAKKNHSSLSNFSSIMAHRSASNFEMAESSLSSA